MTPQFTDLKYFLTVSETLNVTRASERLGVVQPTLSLAIRRLETAAGVELFIRRKNGMELTRAGQVLAKQARDFANSWQFLLEQLKESETQPTGHFTIGAHVSVAWYMGELFLPKLLQENQKIELTLAHSSSREVLAQVISGKVDFGLVINPYRHPDLVIRKICQDRYSLWRSGDCLNKDVLIFNPDVPQNEKVFKKLKNKDDFKRQVATASFEIVAKLAASGAGVGMLPERVAKAYDLVMWEPGAWTLDELFLCYRRDRQKSAGSRVIIESIRAARI